MNRYSSRPIQRLAIERQAATNLTTAVKSGTLTKVQGNKLLVAAPQRLAKAPAYRETASCEGEGCTAKDRARLEGRA